MNNLSDLKSDSENTEYVISYLESINLEELEKKIQIFEHKDYSGVDEDTIKNDFLDVINSDDILAPLAMAIQPSSTHEWVFYRGRKLDENETSQWTEEKHYWENPKAPLWRLNKKNESALYVALNYNTVLNEINATDDQKFTISIFKLKKDIEVFLVDSNVEFDTSKFSKEEIEKFYAVYHFIIRTLYRVERGAHEVSCSISHYLIENLKIDGIAYYSVKEKNGINFCFYHSEEFLTLVISILYQGSNPNFRLLSSRVPNESGSMKITNKVEWEKIENELQKFENYNKIK